MLRSYDAAVMNFLRLGLGGEAVPMVFASPRREFGTQEELEPLNSGDLPPHGDRSVRVPSMAVQRLNWTFSEARANFARHRKLKWSTDLNFVTKAQHPLAYDISYQLDIWTRYRDDANVLTNLTLIKFPRRVAPLTVDLGDPWGEKRVFFYVTSVTDNTELETEDGDREVRMTIDLMLEAWLPLPPEDVRTVRKVVSEVDVMWFDDRKGVDAVAFKKTLEEG